MNTRLKEKPTRGINHSAIKSWNPRNHETHIRFRVLLACYIAISAPQLALARCPRSKAQVLLLEALPALCSDLGSELQLQGIITDPLYRDWFEGLGRSRNNLEANV
jgi:hypothetical protein